MRKVGEKNGARKMGREKWGEETSGARKLGVKSGRGKAGREKWGEKRRARKV